jgi:hypothetical protein
MFLVRCAMFAAVFFVTGSALATLLKGRLGPKPPLVASPALSSLGLALLGRPRQPLQH